MIIGGIREIKCDRCGTTYDFNNDITSSVMDAIDEIKEYGWTVPDIDRGGPIIGTIFDCYCPECSELRKEEADEESNGSES